MVVVGFAHPSEREDIKKITAEYHSSEGIRPTNERIARAADQQLRGESPGLLLAARDKRTILGVTLAVYTPSGELGRVITVNDFLVRPSHRRKGARRELAKHLMEECNG